MRTNKWMYLIAIVALAWVACDDDDDKGIDKPELNDTDESFVELAARINLAEIEFGGLATTNATDSLVKVYGQEMIDEHTAAQNELKAIADDFDDIDWPDDLHQAHDSIMTELTNAEATRFDSLYIASQVQMHEDGASAFETATMNTTDARVKAYATKYLPHIEAHLQKADSIQTVIMATDIIEDTID